MTTPEVPDAHERPAAQPSYGRRNAVAMLAIALVLLACNAVLLWSLGRYFPIVLFLVPGLLLVGVAGLIEPRIALAISPEAKTLALPLWARIVGPALMVGGMAAGAWLGWIYLR